MAMRDIWQSKKKLKRPEYRVWVHGNLEKGGSGDDYAHTFDTEMQAQAFKAMTNKPVEDDILVAQGGMEYTLKEYKRKHPFGF